LWQALAGTPHEVRYVHAAGTRTRVLLAGEGEPVLLLHGTGGHLESFMYNIGPLAQRYQVVAVDLLGHGYTDLPPSGDYDWRAVAEHVVATLDALHLDRPTWIGEALGAQAAQWAAAKMSDRVDRLVLCCAGILPADDAADVSVANSQASFQEVTRRALAEPGSASIMRERMRWLHLTPDAVNDELLLMRMHFWSQPGFVDAHKRLLGSLPTARTSPRTALSRDDLAGLGAATLVIWTEQNPLMSVDVGRRLASLLGPADVELFAESAMWPQVDEADKFNRVVLDWLGRTRSSAPEALVAAASARPEDN
jgi:2-hydroxy-6-oxonona-2,4-dienedioate hydrolase